MVLGEKNPTKEETKMIKVRVAHNNPYIADTIHTMGSMDDLYDYLTAHHEDDLKDAFEDWLDSENQVMICGHRYKPSGFWKDIDPIAYEENYNLYVTFYINEAVYWLNQGVETHIGDLYFTVEGED